MQRWQTGRLVIDRNPNSAQMAEIDALGLLGWELVFGLDGSPRPDQKELWFKRPVEEA